ncbi:hypothetical protein [uncultured Brevundimonas sp.]|uniref:hypothetical protein n=1 Tax=uncultured Brevundimonas sp. TaxID=213418 RepID=UPI0030EC6B3B
MSSPVSIVSISTSRRDQIDRMAEAGLIREGRVFTLSLAPIREQLGSRWDTRSDHIWDGVERALLRKLPPPDVFIRLDDITVLAAIASSSGYDAQVTCTEVLRSVLTFFLGRNADEDVQLARVSDVSGGQLSCVPVDPSAPPPRPAAVPPVSRAGATASEATETDCTPASWTPPLAGRSYATPFVTAKGEAIPMVIDVTAVWRLDGGGIAAYALRRRLPHSLGPLSDADREAIDLATFARLNELLVEYQNEGGMFALFVPVYFESISARRQRNNLVGRSAGVVDVMRKAVVLEIEDMHAGLPTGRVGEAVSLMRPFVRSMMARVSEPAMVERLMSEYAFTALTADGALHRRGFRRLSRLLDAMRRRSRNILLHEVPHEAEDTVRAAGVSHITLPGEDDRRDGRPESTPWVSEDDPSPGEAD